MTKPRTDIAFAAFDLDGTLLMPDGSVSARTLRALEMWRAAGKGFTIVTARPPRQVASIAKALNASFAVCSNGALVYTFNRSTAIASDLLDAELAMRLVCDLVRAVPEATFALENGTFLRKDPGFPHPEPWDQAWENVDVRTHETEALIKLVVHDSSRPIGTLYDVCQTVVGGQASVTRSSDHYVEIARIGVSKANGLAKLCAMQDVSAGQVVAFGDMPNDIPMLDWAGLSVGMENGHTAVKKYVDIIAEPNTADGVALILERLLEREVS